MNKAFTLIEMMIAIIIFSLITIFLSSTLQSVRQNSLILNSVNDSTNKQDHLLKLLQADIQESTRVSVIEGDNYVLLTIRSLNSLYKIAHPFIRWFVDPVEKRLIRSESAINELPPYDSDKLNYLYLDLASKNCTWFKAYQSQNKNSILLSLNCNQKSILFEILTPQLLIGNGNPKKPPTSPK